MVLPFQIKKFWTNRPAAWVSYRRGDQQNCLACVDFALIELSEVIKDLSINQHRIVTVIRNGVLSTKLEIGLVNYNIL